MASIWMASPPEVLVGTLCAGPGAGPMMKSAAAWTELSAKHALASAELTVELSVVQSEGWQGPGGESYVAAHVPYVEWLGETSIGYARAAADQESAVVAYETAVAAMPPLAEISANRAALAALVVTNFLGINLIPIAVLETAYRWMWIQAATVMSAYEASSTVQLASAPAVIPAPSLLVPGAEVAAVIFDVPGITAAAGGDIILLLLAIWEIFQALVLLFIVTPFLYWNIFGVPIVWAITPPLLAGGAAVGLPISVPLGVSQHLSDVAMMAMMAGAAGGGAASSRKSDHSRQDEPVLLVDAPIGVPPAGRPASLALAETTDGHGAGAWGFTATAYKHGVAHPCGLSADSELGLRSRLPLVPATWAGS